MKIIDAFWEERNLGRRTAEIVVEKDDSFPVLLETLGRIEKEKDYIVVKFPPTFVPSWQELESRGYRFAECLLSFAIQISEFHEKKEYRLFREEQGIEKVDTPEQLAYLQGEFRKGIFETDRIALSPFFGAEKGNFRYSMWVNDLFSKPVSSHFFITWKGKRVGFFSIRECGKGTAQGLLTGIFQGFRKKHLGFGVVYHPLKLLKEKGFVRYSTVVSSNNLPAVRLYPHFGFQVTEIQNVFVRCFPEME